MTVMQRILFVFIVVVGLLATASIMFLKPVSSTSGRKNITDTFVADRVVDDPAGYVATTDASKDDTNPPETAKTPKTAEEVDTCPTEVLDKATKRAFRTKLSRDPTAEELADFRKKLHGLAVSADNCRPIALMLASEYINRLDRDDAPNAKDKNVNSDECTHDDIVAAIRSAFDSKLDRAPRNTEIDHYVTRLAALELSADECRATARALMLVYLDREYDSKKKEEDANERDAVVRFTSGQRPEAMTKKTIVNEDVLYQGLAITQPHGKDGCINGAKDDIETKLAKFMRDRNQTFLHNLCKQSEDASKLEKKASHCALSASGCEDGLSLITPQRTQAAGTSLKEAVEMTGVGSVMPRFVYAEYV